MNLSSSIYFPVVDLPLLTQNLIEKDPLSFTQQYFLP